MTGAPVTVPQVVVFDLGKVLVDFDYAILVRALALQSRLSAEALNQFINQSPLLLDYEAGRMTTPEFFAAVQSGTGYTGSLEELGRLYGTIFSPIAPMIALHARLRAQGVPTFIFSNTNALAMEQIRADFPFLSQFDGHIYSFEHGAMKPEAHLYEVVERITGRAGDAIAYLDDRPENIAAGSARGWRAILHADPAHSIAALREMGLPV
ncbi:MAG: HAD family phosphatase [Pedosphaera sp.]|nr:HAD family phosphatase [Pedosphaera sp.]MSU42542.1 HAD family phosphatase [Pedosphaera sp.]